MTHVVQARLDEKSKRALQDLERLGWTPSSAIREGLQLLAVQQAAPAIERIAGVGEFASGIPDLASNKKHLKGFGR